jgi:hypothetical protein
MTSGKGLLGGGDPFPAENYCGCEYTLYMPVGNLFFIRSTPLTRWVVHGNRLTCGIATVMRSNAQETGPASHRGVTSAFSATRSGQIVYISVKHRISSKKSNRVWFILHRAFTANIPILAVRNGKPKYFQYFEEIAGQSLGPVYQQIPLNVETHTGWPEPTTTKNQILLQSVLRKGGTNLAN